MKKIIKIKDKLIYYYKYLYNLLIVNKDNRIKFITSLTVILIFLLVLRISSSFGYYHSDASFTFIRSVVGDKNKKLSDYTLLIYKEEASTSGEKNYILTERIPLIGYTYSGYKCKNGNTLIYDDVNKVTEIVLDNKDECSIYFDIEVESDINIKIMLEETVGSKKYRLVDNIPEGGYIYDRYECENNSEITFDNNRILLSTNKKDTCNVYFNKMNSDINIILFISEDNTNYINRETIPNDTYLLNEERSNCINGNNEMVDVDITYEDGYIYVTPDERLTCNIYLYKE